MVTYTYSIGNDTLNGAVNSSVLHNEIKTDISLELTFIGITLTENNINVLFSADLSAGTLTTLTNIIGNHTGEGVDATPEIDEVPGSGTGSNKGYQIGDIVVNDETAYVLVDATIGAEVWKPITESGRIYYFDEKYSGFTHTSNNWQNAHSWTTPNLPSGRYRVGWSYLWSGDGPFRNFEAQILVGSTRVMLHQQEPQETGGYQEPITPNAGTDQGHWCSGFVFIDLGEGVHTIKLQTRIENGDNECSVHRNVFEIERMGDQSGLDPSQNLTDRAEHNNEEEDD